MESTVNRDRGDSTVQYVHIMISHATLPPHRRSRFPGRRPTVRMRYRDYSTGLQYCTVQRTFCFKSHGLVLSRHSLGLQGSRLELPFSTKTSLDPKPLSRIRKNHPSTQHPVHTSPTLLISLSWKVLQPTVGLRSSYRTHPIPSHPQPSPSSSRPTDDRPFSRKHVPCGADGNAMQPPDRMAAIQRGA